MATTTEIQRLVVRLMGDTADLRKSLSEMEKRVKDSTRASELAIRKFESIFKEAQKTAQNESRKSAQVVDATQKQIQADLRRTNQTLLKSGVNWRTYGTSVKSVGRSVTATGRTLAFTVTAPLAAIGFAAIKTGSELESAFVGVTKTVKGSEVQLQDLREELNLLGTEGGVAINLPELFNIAEVGGQLGIVIDDLEEFTKVAAAMGAATNLSSQEAGLALGRLSAITGLSVQEFNNLGSSIVELGNTTKSSEKEIVALTLRLSGVATSMGLTVQETAALAASLTSVGVAAELGGTAFNRLFLQIAAAISSGSDELEAFASTAGQTTEQFAKSFDKNALGAVVDILKGLKTLNKFEGETVFEAMGIEGIRLREVLLRSAGAVDGMTKAIEDSNKAFIDGEALIEEAQKRYESFAGQVQLAKNEIALAAEELFLEMKPALLDILDSVKEVARAFKELSPGMKQFLIVTGLIAAVIGPVVIVLGLFISGLGNIIRVLSIFTASLAAIKGVGAALVIAQLTANIRTMALALISAQGAALALAAVIAAPAILRAKKMYDDLNESIEKSAELQDIITSRIVKSFRKISNEVSKIESPEEQKLFLSEGIEKAQKQLESYENQVLGATENVKVLNDEWKKNKSRIQAAAQAANATTGLGQFIPDVVEFLGFDIDNKVLEEAKQELQEVKDVTKLVAEEVSRLKREFEALEEAQKPGFQTLEMKKANADILKVNESLKLQIATLGMSAREAKLYSLSLSILEGDLTSLNAFQDTHRLTIELNKGEIEEDLDEFIESIKKKTAEIGVDDFDIKLERFIEEGVDTGKIVEAQQANEVFEIRKKELDLIKEGRKLMEQFRTPQEIFAKAELDLKALLDLGAINEKVFESALEEAQDILEESKNELKATVKFEAEGVDAVAAASKEAIARVRDYMELRPSADLSKETQDAAAIAEPFSRRTALVANRLEQETKTAFFGPALGFGQEFPELPELPEMDMPVPRKEIEATTDFSRIEKSIADEIQKRIMRIGPDVGLFENIPEIIPEEQMQIPKVIDNVIQPLEPAFTAIENIPIPETIEATREIKDVLQGTPEIPKSEQFFGTTFTGLTGDESIFDLVSDQMKSISFEDLDSFDRSGEIGFDTSAELVEPRIFESQGTDTQKGNEVTLERIANSLDVLVNFEEAKADQPVLEVSTSGLRGG